MTGKTHRQYAICFGFTEKEVFDALDEAGKSEVKSEETVKEALKQIKEKDYDAELIKRGVKPENIRHYGFAFRGKEVLIGEG